MESLFINARGLRFHVHAWGKPSQPVIVLIAGTAFVSATWTPIAEALSIDYRVYAIDRRGHGASDSPESAYEFFDFAEDLIAVMQTMNIRAELAVGHSAGATDVLLAASLQPDLFNTIFVHEPTVADPKQQDVQPEFPDVSKQYMQSIAKRRNRLPSRADAIEHFRHREPYVRWPESTLLAQWKSGLRDSKNGGVELSCRPEAELQIIEPILHAASNIYRADHRGDPFSFFKHIKQPVALVLSAKSEPFFAIMNKRAQKLLPNIVLDLTLKETRHCAPQENAQGFIAGIRLFTEQLAKGMPAQTVELT